MTLDKLRNEQQATANGLTIHRDLLRWLRSLGDVAERRAVVKQTEIDFGSTPVASATFTVSDADVLTTSYIVARPSYEAPTGKDLDELELDDLVIMCAPGNRSMTMFVRSADGSYLHDKFKINYAIGVG